MMFKAVGKEPTFRYAPPWIFDSIIGTFQFLAAVLKTEGMEDAVETAKIGKYYATEDMLTTDPAEKYGTITVQDHYNRIAAKGEDSSFTPM
jgi:divinyl chlorophyllide a 8-vinyl-reductase